MKNLKYLKEHYCDLDFDLWISLLDRLTLIEFSDEIQERLWNSSPNEHFNKIIDPYQMTIKSIAGTAEKLFKDFIDSEFKTQVPEFDRHYWKDLLLNEWLLKSNEK